jgi:hypothetical protein
MQHELTRAGIILCVAIGLMATLLAPAHTQAQTDNRCS